MGLLEGHQVAFRIQWNVEQVLEKDKNWSALGSG